MTRTSDYLNVYEGETGENIIIETVDENDVAIDPTFGAWGSSQSKLEIKTTDLATVSTTLETTDFVSENSTSVSLSINKLGALSRGTYVAILTLDSGAGQVKVLKYHLRVHPV